MDGPIRTARFLIQQASVAEIDYREGRGITPVRMKRHAAHDWSAGPTNLLMISPIGDGKTYLACAIGIAACQNGHTVTYARMDELALRLVITQADGIAHQKLFNELSNTDLLIIDDFRTVGIDSDAASDLFAILANREHRLPTMIASQTGPDHRPRRDRHAPTPPGPGSHRQGLLGVTGSRPGTYTGAATGSIEPRYQLRGLALPPSPMCQQSAVDAVCRRSENLDCCNIEPSQMRDEACGVTVRLRLSSVP